MQRRGGSIGVGGGLMGTSHVLFLELGVCTAWQCIRLYTCVVGTFVLIKGLAKKVTVKCLSV